MRATVQQPVPAVFSFPADEAPAAGLPGQRFRVVHAALRPVGCRGSAGPRSHARPFSLGLLLAAAVAASGCSGVARLVSTRVEIRAGTNAVTLIQPKDTTLRRLQFDPRTGCLVMEDYASAGNTAAIESARAQAAAQAAAFDRGVRMMEWGMQALARSQGLQLENPPSSPSAATETAPAPATARGAARMKLVPIDDPSLPHREVLVVPEP